ncbi:hypothetical protein HFO74_35035 [Rhizobium laguerreae]|uniref:Secreted protein n=1 Tax=Rhizobium laguerreae TaxID=1076926 RepID=A0AB35FNU8_9HYPH|nr:hypothetical protein [Rhizobium laguerreae]MBY3068547.1 hypothetical protein [Rhizobium laguerreae]
MFTMLMFLRSLCAHNDDGRLNKFVVVRVGVILEAALGQIIYRAQNFNRESAKHLPKPTGVKLKAKRSTNSTTSST